jgi:hypothetical protein
MFEVPQPMKSGFALGFLGGGAPVVKSNVAKDSISWSMSAWRRISLGSVNTFLVMVLLSTSR